ncbi:type II toxin-antitoxin system RelE/ParE family toxin [Chromatium okenii]|jgi:mRNA interferase YafQ|uniref:Type II toxin-antitoxin system mRNA interferase toxin, RelE/StbE family n=1 Tax=Chromatium okenii TaxID=61644 RepID=A0A2S7XS86_9GAMM|nr:type II toxin-antitoxin system YafQ family toxin [Chromatium okenii]MBV5310041.1 type II toxin-antitoxin system YafQ family toxin [Chromatium okenii]PQJ96614.1 type II toxin-antitoxin system mRNA interferase toxin, RelE/StbE family [Chromatium okenii]
MRTASYTSQFKRDVKRIEKRGKELRKLREVINLLLTDQPLPRELGDHPLKGGWQPSRDLHLEADWILIYYLDGDSVRFERTGTHADLFHN